MRFHLFHHSPQALLLSFSGGEWSVTHLTSTYNASLPKMEMILSIMFLLLTGEHSTNLCVVLICSDCDIFHRVDSVYLPLISIAPIHPTNIFIDAVGILIYGYVQVAKTEVHSMRLVLDTAARKAAKIVPTLS